MRREYTKIFANQQNTYIIEGIKLVSITNYEISQKVKKECDNKSSRLAI